MRNVKINNYIIILLIILSSCTHKGYDEVEDVGEWRSLGHMDREEWYLRVGDSIYSTDLPIEEVRCCVKYNKPLKVDVSTFEVSEGCDYAKDKKHVYYPIHVTCEDWLAADEEGCVNSCYFIEYLVKGADPKTFKYLGEDYAIDRRNMYLRGERIPWDDKVIEQAKKRRRHQ